MTHHPAGRTAMSPEQAPPCEGCSLSDHCLPGGLARDQMTDFDAILHRPRPLRRGGRLVQQGAPFTSLYVVRSGSFKQVVVDEAHRELVTHFLLPSDVVGLDAVGEAFHPSGAVALESSSVCELPFRSLEALGDRFPALRAALYRSMSQVLYRDQIMNCLLSCATAEERTASFLLDMSKRHAARGYSPHAFQLAMSRADIGSFLGLALETVSRLIGRFQRQGLISVEGRTLVLHDIPALEALVASPRRGR